MPGKHHQPRKLSAFDHLILACDKAAFFLTPNRQSYAQFNGTAAPLYSEQFRGWLLTRIEADGLAWPSASTLGRLLSAKILAPFLEEMDAAWNKGGMQGTDKLYTTRLIAIRKARRPYQQCWRL